MNNNYHGILVSTSQKDSSIFKALQIIGKREIDNSNWILYKIEADPSDLWKIIDALQKNMHNDYYFHFYRNTELIVVYKERIFEALPDKSTWKEIIDYGKLMGIPESQLDFHPCRIEDETF